MTLIKSISGIRGTVGNLPGNNLTPQDIVECTAAYAAWLKNTGANQKIVLGRDGRISGKMYSAIAANTLIAMGFDVIDLGLSTTPTVEMAVPIFQAGGGIILTASHNPKQWNALKLLNREGEFISAKDGQEFLDYIGTDKIIYAEVNNLGTYTKDKGMIKKHIQAILDFKMVDITAIKEKKFKVVVDCINSTGAISVPPLLEQLGCECVVINAKVNGDFAHNPEPLAKHLTELSAHVVSEKADLGISIDPDVDRLAFVSEDGTMFGEEYTLVAIADYMLGLNGGGNTVSNLSSTRALRAVTEQHGGTYFAAAVGEVNVVTKMKKVKALIGGEGNGGVIVPDFHYGRDALIGIGLFLSLLAHKGQKMTELRESYPSFAMVKDKIQLIEGLNVEALLKDLHEIYKSEDCLTIDGLKIDFAESWIHLRKSNTEPILRVYAEASDMDNAKSLVNKMKNEVSNWIELCQK